MKRFHIFIFIFWIQIKIWLKNIKNVKISSLPALHNILEEPTINSTCCEFELCIGLVLLEWLFIDVGLIEVVHMWLCYWILSWQNWTKAPTLDMECIFCLLHVHCVVCIYNFKKTCINSDICRHFSYGNMCKVGICMK
jgi:hypothetical protein